MFVSNVKLVVLQEKSGDHECLSWLSIYEPGFLRYSSFDQSDRATNNLNNLIFRVFL